MKLCLAIFQNYMLRLRQRFIMNISELDNLIYTIVKDMYLESMREEEEENKNLAF